MGLEERDEELAALGRVLEAARSGAGRGLLIEGPPGIGKTRLLHAAPAEDMTVLSARASELERDFPFAVVRQLLEPVARDELFTGAAELALPVLRGVGRQEEDAGAVLHGLYWLTANLAAERPVVVLVDDLHWADLPSLRWLAYLAQRIDGLAVALIAAARPAEAGDGQPVLDVLAANPFVDVIEPRGLSEHAVARALGAGAEPGFVAACAQVTGGNPFLLEELLRELAQVAPTDANAPLVARQTSRTVSRAALARLRRLPREATALAHAVVILGDGAEPAVAAALAGLEEDAASRAADALEAAAIFAPGDASAGGEAASAAGGGAAVSGGTSAGGEGVRTVPGGAVAGGEAARAVSGVALTSGAAARAAVGGRAVVRGGARPARGRRLSFAHPLVRESVYAELSAGERARGHTRAAELLTAAGADAERVAIHRHEADPAGDEEAVQVLREAAASARRRGATEVAASHLRRALREPPEDPQPVHRELGAVELQAGRYDEAAEHLQAAADDDPQIALELGAALQLADRPEEAVAALSRAIDALGDDQRELGLLLQATRGAASQGNRAAAALARQSGLRFAADARRTVDARRAPVRRRARLPRDDARPRGPRARARAAHARPARGSRPQRARRLRHPARAGLLRRARGGDARVRPRPRLGPAPRLVSVLRPGLAPARGGLVAAREPRRGRGRRRERRAAPELHDPSRARSCWSSSGSRRTIPRARRGSGMTWEWNRTRWPPGAPRSRGASCAGACTLPPAATTRPSRTCSPAASSSAPGASALPRTRPGARTRSACSRRSAAPTRRRRCRPRTSRAPVPSATRGRSGSRCAPPGWRSAVSSRWRNRSGR